MKKGCFLIVIFLAGCGPIYSTEFRFSAPNDSRTNNCIDNCKDLTDRCKEHQNYQKDLCEAENQRLMSACNDRVFEKKQRTANWTECGRQLACDFSEERCEEGYRSCYRSCGGQVTEEKVCILNCEDRT